MGHSWAAQAAYWKQRLADAPALFELPGGAARPAARGTDCRTLRRPIPATPADRVEHFSATAGVAPFLTYFAVFGTLAHRLTGQTDLVIGTPVAAPVEPPINVLPMRLDLSGRPSFAEVVARVRRETADAYARPDLPLEQIAAALNAARTPSYHPVVQIVFGMRDAAAPYEIPVERGAATFDMTWTVLGGAGPEVEVEYNVDLYDDGAVVRLVESYLRLLEAAMEAPGVPVDGLDLLPPAERERLLAASQGPAYAGRAPEPAALLLPEQTRRWADRRPEAIALCDHRGSRTYAELDAEADRLAAALRAAGSKRGTVVGIRLGRDADVVLTIMAVLRTGAAYLPITRETPIERVRFILGDAGARVLVTGAGADAGKLDGPWDVFDLDAWLTGQSAEPATPVALADGPEPGDTAYIIYTSGSTGRPKGVRVSHRNIGRLMSATERWFRFGPADVWTMFHSHSFDVSVWEMWGALAYGGRLVVVPPEVTRSPAEFHELLRRERVTVLTQSPSAFRALEQADAASSAALDLRLIVFCGEAVDLASVGRWFGRHGDQEPRLVNMYGITETTVHVTYRPLTAADVRTGRNPIGVPIDDLAVYVLDAAGDLAPTGVPGEMYVGGAGVAQGYLNRPDLTDERFLPDRFAPRAGGRLYRTGDLARRTADGELEYLGRNDHQVKVRGFRIETGEIEFVLTGHPAVTAATVMARPDRHDVLRLVAYVACGEEVPTARLREFARRSLPDYMIPAIFVRLDRLPITANGKVDRAALPEPDASRPELGRQYVAPRGEIERTLAAIWGDVLEIDRVGAGDSFFDLGGDSIRGIRIAGKARQHGLDVNVEQILRHPTPARLAAAVSRAGTTAEPAPRHEPRRRRFPLTWQQQRVFAQGRRYGLTPRELGGGFFIVAMVYRLTGPVDPRPLGKAVAEIVARHAALRTSFETGDGDPVAVTHDEMSVPLPVIPVGSEEEITDQVRSAVVEEPFPLDTGPLLRVRLLTAGPQAGVLIVAMHHIVSDGWTFGVFFQELSSLYNAYLRGESPRLPEQPVGYGDYALWQTGRPADGQRAYWRDRLRDLRPLPVPTDRPRDGNADRHSVRLGLELPGRLVRRLHALGGPYGVTLHMTLAATIMTFLAGLCDTGDIALGTPIANRGVHFTEQVIGVFTNTVILRTQLGAAPSFPDVLAAVRETVLQAYRNPDVPPEKLADSGEVPVRVLFALQNAPLTPPGLHEVTAEEYPVPRDTSKYDLVFSLTERHGELSGYLDYRTAFFDEATARGFAAAWRALVEDVVHDPEAPTSGLLRHGAGARPRSLR